MDATDIELLNAYAETGDEECFAELVKRHLALVYSTALRSVGGDTHMAQDVTQVVFTHLAQNAKSLLGQRALAGWLYRDAFFSGSKLVRSERRRLEREKRAIMHSQITPTEQLQTNELLPVLDKIVSRLRPKERDALVLRFFEGMELRTAASLLGISEEAFQKRVERAVQKIRAELGSKGVTAGSRAVASALLAGGLMANTPPNLASMVAASSLAGAAAAKTSAFLTIVSNFTMTKLKITGATFLVVALTAPLFIQRNALTSLREENRQLRNSARESPAQNNEIAPLSVSIDPAEAERLRSEHLELMRLRGEVGVRRRQLEELRDQLDQASRTEPRARSNQQQEASSPYHAVETWANVGYDEPQSAAITFFWALREGNQAGYSGAFGREMPDLEDAWVDAFRSVKGSFLSKPEQLRNGDIRVNVAHETTDGNIVNTLITYRQENGQSQIHTMAGFPTGTLDTSSQTASYEPLIRD